MPPPSSGGIAIALIVHQLEALKLGELGWHSAPALHFQAEAMRRAFAVRNQLLGDPDFVDVPTATLLSHPYADGLRASIDGWTVVATIERRDGRWIGASDPRLHGSAAGY